MSQHWNGSNVRRKTNLKKIREPKKRKKNKTKKKTKRKDEDERETWDLR